MTVEQARTEHKKLFGSSQRLFKEIFLERYNEGQDMHKLIHTPRMFSVRDYSAKTINRHTRKIKNALSSYGIC